MNTPGTEARGDQGDGENRLLAIPDNTDAFVARALTAREATDSIDLMYYGWHDDGSGHALLEAVVEAAMRGVRVRLLIDDINPHRSDAIYLVLDDTPNVSVKLFNPSRARGRSFARLVEMIGRMRAMTRRMHCKAWIVDRRKAIIGGRNIGDEYFDAAETNFRDLDLLIEGPVVDQACAIFDQYWNHEASVAIHDLYPMRRRRVRFFRRRRERPELKAPSSSINSVAELVERAGGMDRVETVRIIADPPDKVLERQGDNWLMQQVTPLFLGARKRVDLVSPYFIPGQEGVKIVGELVAHGVKTTILTNSLAATDVAAVHGAYSNYRREILHRGAEIYELQPFENDQRMSVFGSKGASLHTKAFVIDDRIGFVGSLNFDPRSASLNAEMGVLFEDETVAQRLAALIERQRQPESSYRVYLDGKRLVWEGHDGGTSVRCGREPEASVWRRLIAGVVRWLPMESQL